MRLRDLSNAGDEDAKAVRLTSQQLDSYTGFIVDFAPFILPSAEQIQRNDNPDHKYAGFFYGREIRKLPLH